MYSSANSGSLYCTLFHFSPGDWPSAALSELLLQQRFQIVGLAHVQAVLLTFLSPVEVPVRTPSCFGLGVGPVLKMDYAPAAVPALNDAALLNKLLAPTFDGFADPLKVRSVQPGDGAFDRATARISAADRGMGTVRISALSQGTGRPLAFSKGGLWVVVACFHQSAFVHKDAVPQDVVIAASRVPDDSPPTGPLRRFLFGMLHTGFREHFFSAIG